MIHIDEVETEVLRRESEPGASPGSEGPGTQRPMDADQVRALVRELLQEELERALRRDAGR